MQTSFLETSKRSEASTNPPKLPDRFYQLSDLFGLAQWVTDLGIVACCVVVSQHWLFTYPLIAFIIGARQRGLAELLHQASHRSLMRTRWLNDLFGTWLCGYLVFQTWEAYRESHVANHHGHFGQAKDPDFAFHNEIGLYGDVTLSGLLRGFLRYWRYLIVNRLVAVSGNTRELIRVTALWAVIVWLCGPTLVVAYWLVPMLLGHSVIGFCVEIAEHWPLMNAKHALYRTRNRASSRLEAAFFSAHNENLHLVHHLYPRLGNQRYKDVDAYLKKTWPAYEEWAHRNGGVIVSANGAPSVLHLLLKAVKVTRRATAE